MGNEPIIHPTAKLGSGVHVGPWSMIGPCVVVGEGTKIGPHVVIGENTTIGRYNEISPFVSIGTDAQYLGKETAATFLEIGDHNIIREFVTINRGTSTGSGITRIGHHNYLMAYAHIAHDCVVGNHVIFSNLASIAGHVTVGDRAILGPFAGVHQFCQIGAYSFLGRGTKVYQDILPYMLVTGNPGVPRGLNIVGLRRNGFSNDRVLLLKRAYHLICRKDSKFEILCQELVAWAKEHPDLQPFVDIIRISRRGVARKMQGEGDTLEMEDREMM